MVALSAAAARRSPSWSTARVSAARVKPQSEPDEFALDAKV